MLCICHDLGVVHKLRYHFWGICLPDGQGNLSKSEFFRKTLCAYNFLRGHYPQKPCALSNPNMFAKRVSRTSLSALYMAKVMIQCEKMKYLHWKSRQVLNAQKPRLPFFFREHPYNISLLTRGNIENRWWKICNIENLYWKKLSNMCWKISIMKKQVMERLALKL